MLEKYLNTKTKRIISYALAVLVFIVLFFISYAGYKAVLTKFEIKGGFATENSSIAIYEGNSIEQRANMDNRYTLKSVYLKFHTNGEKIDGTVNIHIYNAENNELLYSKAFDGVAIRSGNIATLTLDKKVKTSQIIIKIDSTIQGSDKMAIVASTDNSGGLTINSQSEEGSILSAGVHTPNPMAKRYFAIIYGLLAIPLLAILLFKLGILNLFFNDISKLQIIDYVLFGGVLLFLFLLSCHGDIFITGSHGLLLWEALFSGKIKDFYLLGNYPSFAAYDMTTYFIFAIWNLPLYLLKIMTGLPFSDPYNYETFNMFVMYWNKLLPTLFYGGCGIVLYKIAKQIGISTTNSKWLTFLFYVSPIAVFSQFIFGQYDSIGLLFTLISVLLFLKKSYYKSTLIMAIAVSVKTFPLFIFIPLILLIEKRPLHILKFLALVLLPSFILSTLFPTDTLYTITSDFKWGMVNRIFSSGVSGGFTTISFIISAFIILSVYAYLKKDYTEDEFNKQTVFICAIMYSVIFAFLLWHPQWVIIVTPFILLLMFQNERQNITFALLAVTSIGFLIFSPYLFVNNVDASMLNSSTLYYIFGNMKEQQFTLNSMYSYFGKISAVPYQTLFSVPLLIINYLCYPGKSNVAQYQTLLDEKFAIKREWVWLYGLLPIFLFAVPSIILFFM